MDAHEWTAAAAGCAAERSEILSCRPAWHLQDTLDGKSAWATDLCFGVWTEFINIDFYNKCHSHHSILCTALAALICMQKHLSTQFCAKHRAWNVVV